MGRGLIMSFWQYWPDISPTITKFLEVTLIIATQYFKEQMEIDSVFLANFGLRFRSN